MVLEVKLLRSLRELVEIQEPWDRLWEQSDSTSPLTRNQPLVIWLKHFADERDLRVVTVWESDQLVAALPLVIVRKRGLKVAELPNNEWSFSGDLLIEKSNQANVMSALVQGLNQVETLAVCLDWVKLEQPKWSVLLNLLKARQQSAFSKPRFAVAEIPAPASPDAFLSGLSKNHRKKMRRADKALAAHGNVELVDYESSKLADHLNEAFAIEHRGWKGDDGTSIRSDRNVESYFRSLAASLDADGFLAIQFLRVDGRAVAFDFGFLAKGVRGSHKISYDPEFAKSSPGQVLVGKQIENALDDGVERFDTIGPATEAIQKWTDATYESGKVVLSNRRWTSRATVGAISQVSRILSKLKTPTASG